jgi:hypothetical protein
VLSPIQVEVGLISWHGTLGFTTLFLSWSPQNIYRHPNSPTANPVFDKESYPSGIEASKIRQTDASAVGLWKWRICHNNPTLHLSKVFLESSDHWITLSILSIAREGKPRSVIL